MRARAGVVISAISLGLLAAGCADGFREDEMDCEQAVAHLETCCGHIDVAQSACTHQSAGGLITPTALTADESRCVLGESCEGLRSNGVCGRATQLPSPNAGSTSAVCP
jgi:hypothetical protein